MKKPADFSDTINRGATEARDRIQTTAAQIEAEWKRIIESIDDSDAVPGQVKVVVDRLDGTAGEVKQFVVTTGPKVMAEGFRVARQVGVPIPEDWPEAWTATDDAAAETSDTAEAATEAVADASEAADAVADTVEDTVEDTTEAAADTVEDAVEDTVGESAEDSADDKA